MGLLVGRNNKGYTQKIAVPSNSFYLEMSTNDPNSDTSERARALSEVSQFGSLGIQGVMVLPGILLYIGNGKSIVGGGGEGQVVAPPPYFLEDIAAELCPPPPPPPPPTI